MFPPNIIAPSLVVFTLIVDGIAEESEETFTISFSSPISDTEAVVHDTLDGTILDIDGKAIRHKVG